MHKYLCSNLFPDTRLETSCNHIIKSRMRRCYCILPVSHHGAEIRSPSAEWLELSAIREACDARACNQGEPMEGVAEAFRLLRLLEMTALMA